MAVPLVVSGRVWVCLASPNWWTPYRCESTHPPMYRCVRSGEGRSVERRHTGGWSHPKQWQERGNVGAPQWDTEVPRKGGGQVSWVDTPTRRVLPGCQLFVVLFAGSTGGEVLS